MKCVSDREQCAIYNIINMIGRPTFNIEKETDIFLWELINMKEEALPI